MNSLSKKINILPDEVYIFTLWYYPSHFGLHIDDIASAFRRNGVKTHIISVTNEVFKESYFDSVRHMFIRGETKKENNLKRLKVREFISRGYLAPIITLKDQSALSREILKNSKNKRVMFFHIFEAFVPFFNKEKFPNIEKCCIYYAGNFVARTIKQFGSTDFSDKTLIKLIIDANISHLYKQEDQLDGVDYIVSETHSLVEMFNKTKTNINVRFFHRPLEHNQVEKAKKIDVRKLHNLEENSVLFVYAGRPTKNAEVLLDILKKAKKQIHFPIYLLLIGTQNYDISKWKNYGEVKYSIINIPFLKRASLYGYLKDCNVLTYPGVVDGHPKIISEAQEAGIPVVAFTSEASGTGEFIKNGETGILIPEGNTTMFVDNVVKLLLNKRLYNKIARNSRTFVREYFSDANFVQTFA